MPESSERGTRNSSTKKPSSWATGAAVASGGGRALARMALRCNGICFTPPAPTGGGAGGPRWRRRDWRAALLRDLAHPARRIRRGVAGLVIPIRWTAHGSAPTRTLVMGAATGDTRRRVLRQGTRGLKHARRDEVRQAQASAP